MPTINTAAIHNLLNFPQELPATGNLKTQTVMTGNPWEKKACTSRASFLSNIGLWSFPLFTFSTYLCLYLAWYMYHKNAIISRRCSRLISTTNLESGVHTSKDSEVEHHDEKEIVDGRATPASDFKDIQSQVVGEAKLNLKAELGNVVDQVYGRKDVEAQQHSCRVTRLIAWKDFTIGTAIMLLNAITLYILAMDIQVTMWCLFDDILPLSHHCILWMFYGVVCLFSVIGFGCWVNLLRNLGGPEVTLRGPDHAEIAVRAVEKVVKGLSYIWEGPLMALFVAVCIMFIIVVWIWRWCDEIWSMTRRVVESRTRFESSRV